MPALDRYYSSTAIGGGAIRLEGDEAHHLIHVMRARPGAQVTIFDGSGREAVAEVQRVGRSDVELAVLSCETIDREFPIEVILGVSLPKGDRQKWLVEKAVELGVHRLVPLVTTRSVVQPGPEALRRLGRTVIEASKQCGRNRLMEIAQPQAWPDLVNTTRDVPTRWIAHPANEGQANDPQSEDHHQRHDAMSGPILLAVGPEGGFTADEVALAVAAGWSPVDLGPRILRIETAAICLVAIATQEWLPK